MTTRRFYPPVDARTFFEMSFSDRKAELDEGIVRIIDGVSAWHSIVQGNILATLHQKLRGSGHSVCGSSFPIRVNDFSVRRADAMIVPSRNGPAHDEDRFADDPIVVFELTSRGVSRTDLPVKIAEYKTMPTIDTIVVIDVVAERLKVVQRTGLRCWSEIAHDEPVDPFLPFLGLTLTHAEIFARD